MPPIHWNSRLYTWVLLLSMMVFVMRAMQLPHQDKVAGYSAQPIESYVTAVAADSSTINRVLAFEVEHGYELP